MRQSLCVDEVTVCGTVEEGTENVVDKEVLQMSLVGAGEEIVRVLECSTLMGISLIICGNCFPRNMMLSKDHCVCN